MDLPDIPVVNRMQVLIDQWTRDADQRAVFLSCYLMMTRNMLGAIGRQEFRDPSWVQRLLEHFAGYYFVALDAYEREYDAAPMVWRLAHNATRGERALALQQLLLGVNAHINYDLVLTLVDLLGPEWAGLDERQRVARYHDYCHVNAVIAATIDAVQDQIVAPAIPLLQTVDWLLGPLDEFLIGRLLTGWRETVWQHALTLLEAGEPDVRARVLAQVESDALRIGAVILGRMPRSQLPP